MEPKGTCPNCKKRDWEFSRNCGAWVCVCGWHNGLARCYCGWSASGGDGYAELVAMGETIEEVW